MGSGALPARCLHPSTCPPHPRSARFQEATEVPPGKGHLPVCHLHCAWHLTFTYILPKVSLTFSKLPRLTT